MDTCWRQLNVWKRGKYSTAKQQYLLPIRCRHIGTCSFRYPSPHTEIGRQAHPSSNEGSCSCSSHNHRDSPHTPNTLVVPPHCSHPSPPQCNWWFVQLDPHLSQKTTNHWHQLDMHRWSSFLWRRKIDTCALQWLLTLGIHFSWQSRTLCTQRVDYKVWWCLDLLHNLVSIVREAHCLVR